MSNIGMLVRQLKIILDVARLHTDNASPANAVARVENLEFLADVVPKTTTYKAVKQKSAKDGTAAAPNGGLANGQGTLDGHMGGAQDRAEAQATNGAAHGKMDVDGGDEHDSENTVDEDKEATQSPPERQGHDGMEV